MNSLSRWISILYAILEESRKITALLDCYRFFQFLI